jgi:AcrR family transcriptional regulator
LVIFAGMKVHESTPKERIMQTATRLFHQQGYQATGINQVIKEADVARASLYQHYESKEKLCIAYLNRRHDHWFAKLKKHVDRAGEPKKKILAAFDFIHAMNKEENYQGCAFLNMLGEISDKEKEILDIIQNHKIDVRKFLGSLITGDKSIKDHIYLLFESAIMESKLFRSQWPVNECKKIVSRMIDS